MNRGCLAGEQTLTASSTNILPGVAYLLDGRHKNRKQNYLHTGEISGSEEGVLTGDSSGETI